MKGPPTAESTATSERRPRQTRLLSRQGTLIGVPILLAAVIAFCFEIRSMSLVNGWWLDELFSIWASDPSLSFIDVFLHRILPDTSPPLYFSALYWTRRLILDERSAITVLNLISLAAALIAVSFAGRRAGVLGWTLVTGAFFLLSGPVLRYTVEGRGYLMALSAAFVASWYCALAIEVPAKRPGLWSFGLIGVIAASIHLYAALICGCLAAGLLGSSLIARRKDLLAPGLILGISACVITTLWLPPAIMSMDRMRWSELSYQSLLAAYWEVRQLALGSHLALLLLVSLFATGLMLPATRSLTVIFSLAFVLFLLLPILVSLKKPIIGGRFWLIGAPSVVVFVSFMTRALFAHNASRVRGRLYRAGALVGLSFLLITDISGFFVARASTAEKENWSGAAIVAPLLQRCPPGSVHVFTSWGFVPGFAFVAHAPQEVFTSVDAPETVWIGPEDSTCPVLGWAEHVAYRGNERLAGDFVQKVSDDELLQLLKIRALPSEVDIYRHIRGFVVLRRGTLGSE